MPMDTNHIIETSDLRRTFKPRQGPVKAVAGPDLCIAPGEIFGFLGPNGAGKTTTLRMLSTLLPPTSGRARVAGRDLVPEPQQAPQRLGFARQRAGSDPAFNGSPERVLQ